MSKQRIIEKPAGPTSATLGLAGSLLVPSLQAIHDVLALGSLGSLGFWLGVL